VNSGFSNGTGKLPSWIFQLADSCKFLFPIETRALIFHMATFDRERALQQLKEARIAHITGLLPTKQITVNREFILDESKVAFDRILKHDNSAILEVKFTDEVSSYFLLNCHYYLIDVFYFSGRTWVRVLPYFRQSACQICHGFKTGM
jgi:hypothetical protein